MQLTFFRIEILQNLMAKLKTALDIDPLALRTFVCTFTPTDLLLFIKQLPLDLVLANLYYHVNLSSSLHRALKVIFIFSTLICNSNFLYFYKIIISVWYILLRFCAIREFHILNWYIDFWIIISARVWSSLLFGATSAFSSAWHLS